MIILTVLITILMISLEFCNRVNHRLEQRFYNQLAAASRIEYLTIEELKQIDITKPNLEKAA